MVVTDNRSSHTSASTPTWLADHPRIQHTFIPRGPAGSTCSKAGGGCFAAKPCRAVPLHPGADHASHQVATCQLNAPARPWVGAAQGRPTPPTPRLHLPDLRNVALRAVVGNKSAKRT
jgi:hypothetical protein